MGALSNLKETLSKHPLFGSKTRKVNELPKAEDKGCLSEFIEDDFESETPEISSEPPAEKENLHHWRPGADDDIPYG